MIVWVCTGILFALEWAGFETWYHRTLKFESGHSTIKVTHLFYNEKIIIQVVLNNNQIFDSTWFFHQFLLQLQQEMTRENCQNVVKTR